MSQPFLSRETDSRYIETEIPITYLEINKNQSDNFCDMQKRTKKFLSELQWSFNTVFSGHARGDNFVALTQCQIVATVVTCAQLWQIYTYRQYIFHHVLTDRHDVQTKKKYKTKERTDVFSFLSTSKKLTLNIFQYSSEMGICYFFALIMIRKNIKKRQRKILFLSSSESCEILKQEEPPTFG